MREANAHPGWPIIKKSVIRERNAQMTKITQSGSKNRPASLSPIGAGERSDHREGRLNLRNPQKVIVSSHL